MSNETDYEKQIGQWPLAQNILLDTPTKTIVEMHAHFMLSRAINKGRLTAVIGAGVSSSYGRTSWEELAERIAREELRIADSYKSAKIISMISKNLVEVVGSEKPNSYTLFQVADRLNRKCKLAKQSLPRDVDETGTTMRERVKQQTENDHGHTRNILEILRHGSKSKESDSKWERVVPAPILYKHVSPHARALLEDTGVALLENDERPLAPFHRFLFALTYGEEPGQTEERLEKYREYCLKYRVSERHPTRHEIINENRDPLLILLKSLRVRKFLTTNFDSEIERLFRDEGFRSRPGTKSVWIEDRSAIDPTAATATALLFEPNKVGDLAAFAVRDRSADVGVAYLHGRASPGDEETLIVSEEDYRRRYASDEETKTSVDEALSLAFGANPLLFVGNGMTEDDLLRQLRVLSATPNRLLDRSCFAIMPAWGSQESTNERVKLLQRYGVYTLHYGTVEVTEGSKSRTVYFLKLLNDLNTKIKRELKRADTIAAESDHYFDDLVNSEVHGAIERAFRKKIVLDLEFRVLQDFFGGKVEVNKSNKYLFSYLVDAFMNAFLCDKLLEVEKIFTDWKATWVRLPPPLVLPFDNSSERQCRQLGHAPAAPSPDYRFHARVPSPTFQAFLSDLGALCRKRDSSELDWQSRGCKCHIVAERGSGKGYFFTALENRLNEVKCVLQENGMSWEKCYMTSINHSTEVFSSFDQMIDYLTPDSEMRTGDRCKDLERALKGCSASLIIINGAHVLYDRDGREKNSQITRLMGMLRDAKKHVHVFLIGQAKWGEIEKFERIELRPSDALLLASSYFPTTVRFLAMSKEQLKAIASLASTREGLALPFVTNIEEYESELISNLDVRGEKMIVSLLPSVDPEIVRDRVRLLRSLHSSLGRNRYLYSLVLALAESYCADAMADSNNWSDHLGAARKAIEKCTDIGKTLTSRVRGHKIIEFVLSEHDKRHRQMGGKAFAFRKSADVPKEMQSMIFQRAIIWHLSVIGQPTSADVFLHCPILRKIVGAELSLPHLEAVLGELSERCLIMTISPRTRDGHLRYGVHKAMQSKVLSGLGSPIVDYSTADQYTVSVYASQPNDLPVLTSTAHRDLSETIAGLSAYPDGLRNALNPEDSVSVRRVRAAFGILRSVYSIAVTSRFGDTHAAASIDAFSGSNLGLLEEHRSFVRWVYQQGFVPKDPVFYAEEIAWLNNELV